MGSILLGWFPAALSILRIYTLRILRSMARMSSPQFETVSDFIESVGRARFESALGHPTQVVSRAIKENVMPAHWYFECRDWCREINVEVPEHLFRRSRRSPGERHQQNAKRKPRLQVPHSGNARKRAS